VPASDFRSAVQIVSPPPTIFGFKSCISRAVCSQPVAAGSQSPGDHATEWCVVWLDNPRPKRPAHPLARDIPPHGHDAWVCPLKQKNEHLRELILALHLRRARPSRRGKSKEPVVPETNLSGTISSRWLISFLSADRPRLASRQLSVGLADQLGRKVGCRHHLAGAMIGG